MGTAKRERQKANRQIRLQELAKEQRKEKSKRLTLRIALGVLLFVALVGGVYLIGGKDDSATSTASSTSGLPGATTTTVAPLCLTPATTTTSASATTSTVPAKPTVKVPGANVTALKVTVLKEGTGDGAANCDTVVVHYIGALSTDGTVFDNSYDRGEPFPVTLGAGSVITGWEQGLQGAKKGSQIQIDIPADLAYGDTGSGSGKIPAGASLSFVIDVMDIVPGNPNPAATTTTAAATTVPPATNDTATNDTATTVTPTT